MKRVLLIVVGITGVLVVVAMVLKQTEAVMGLIVALAASLPKIIDKVQ